MSCIQFRSDAPFHLAVVLGVGIMIAGSAFSYSLYSQFDTRERLFQSHAENYFTTSVMRMQYVARPLAQLNYWLSATNPDNISDWKSTLTPAFGLASQLSAIGLARFAHQPGQNDALLELVPIEEAGLDAQSCIAALLGAIKAAVGTRALLASEPCSLERAGRTLDAIGLLLPAPPRGGAGDAALPLDQGWRHAAAVVRAAVLFAPPVNTPFWQRNAGHGVVVYAGRFPLPAALIYRHGPAIPPCTWPLSLCGQLCGGASVSRSLAWAGREWLLVVTSAPLNASDVPVSAVFFLLAGMLAMATGLAFMRVHRKTEGEIAQLAAMRTRELASLNMILLDDIAERKKVVDELSRSQRELRELADHNIKVKEEERKRIAREIHDDLGQNLLALRIDLVLMGSGAPGAVTRENIAHAIDQIDTTMSSMRLIINELRPAVLDLGLEAVIEWEAAKFQRRTGIACMVSLGTAHSFLPDEVSTALYRIVQESLTNIMRHAQASNVHIDLWSDNGWVFLRLADDGVGMAQDCRRKRKSFGLIGIAERIYALGGAFDTDSAPGAGTTLTIAVPFKPLAALDEPPDMRETKASHRHE